MLFKIFKDKKIQTKIKENIKLGINYELRVLSKLLKEYFDLE